MKRILIASLALSGACVSTGARAAAISWGPAFEVASDADLKLAGRTVVYAVRGGDGSPSGTPTTVLTQGGQSVAFEAVTGIYGTGSTFGATTYGDAVDHKFGQANNVTFAVVSERGTVNPLVSFDPGAATRTVYTVGTGNAGLDSLLNSQIWSDGRTAGTTKFEISLNGLAPGTAYEVQIISAADSRTSKYADSTYSASDVEASPSVGTGLAAFADVNGDGVSHVTSIVGDFTAGDVSQRIDLTLTKDRNPGISAIIVTTASPIPEPASAAPLIALAGLLSRRKR